MTSAAPHFFLPEVSIWLERCHAMWLEAVGWREPYTVLCMSRVDVLRVLVGAITCMAIVDALTYMAVSHSHMATNHGLMCHVLEEHSVELLIRQFR